MFINNGALVSDTILTKSYPYYASVSNRFLILPHSMLPLLRIKLYVSVFILV